MCAEESVQPVLNFESGCCEGRKLYFGGVRSVGGWRCESWRGDDW